MDSDDEIEVEESPYNDRSLRWPSSSKDDEEDLDDLIRHIKSMKEVPKKQNHIRKKHQME